MRYRPASFTVGAVVSGVAWVVLGIMWRNGTQVGNINVGRVEPLENGGTLVTLSSPTTIDQLRFTVQSVSGRFCWSEVAALNEIEVIGMAVEPWPVLEILKLFLPMVGK